MTKTVADKLLIKPNTTVWVSHVDRLDLFGPLAEGVQTVDSLGQATVGLLFADDSNSIKKLLASLGSQLSAPAAVWIAYPKANRTDINRDTLWPLLTPYGMRPISQIAIDEVWSALRFRPLKEGEAGFNPGH